MQLPSPTLPSMKILRHCAFVLCCVVFLIEVCAEGNTASKGKKPDQEFDVHKLRGIWRVDHMYACDPETGEIRDLRTDLVAYTFVITFPNRIRMEFEGIKFFEWTIQYDIKKSPVWIDFAPSPPDEQKRKKLGVLRLDGDKLLIHEGTLRSSVRPGDFKQKKGLSSTLYECTRIKK